MGQSGAVVVLTLGEEGALAMKPDRTWRIPVLDAPVCLGGAPSDEPPQIPAAEVLGEDGELDLDDPENFNVSVFSVVLTIAPWNFPYLTAVNSIVPALMAGNAVVLKHAAQTRPTTSLMPISKIWMTTSVTAKAARF